MVALKRFISTPKSIKSGATIGTQLRLRSAGVNSRTSGRIRPMPTSIHHQTL